MAEQQTSKSSTELTAICHCGNIKMIVPYPPKEITECHCSICRRYSAAWGYWPVDEVKFEFKEGAKTTKYAWGDKDKSFDFCSNCGCVCYWWPFDLKEEDGSTATFGLNTRNMKPKDLMYIDRKIEYAWIRQPIDKGAGSAHPDDEATY